MKKWIGTYLTPVTFEVEADDLDSAQQLVNKQIPEGATFVSTVLVDEKPVDEELA